jgi:hypothetical protein
MTFRISVRQLTLASLAGHSLPTALTDSSVHPAEFLSVYHNGLGGVLPSSLGNMVKLTSLFLDEGGFFGTVPTELGGLVNLGTQNYRHHPLRDGEA